MLDKDEGLSSRQCDNKIGHIFGTKHVGHLGTLDPFATGLLIIGVDQGCKSLPYIESFKKCYVATLELGSSTFTGDSTSDIKETCKIPTDIDGKIDSVLDSFIGKSTQIPPMTSAIKVDGEALYKKAHRGEEVERKPRDIEIFTLKKINYSDNKLTFFCEVSEGTYIRVLGEDVALRLGTVGHLISLRRVSIGNIDLSRAKKLSEIDESSLIEPAEVISLPHVEIGEERIKDVKNGKKMKIDSSEAKVLLTQNGKALAVYVREEENIYIPERGLF